MYNYHDIDVCHNYLNPYNFLSILLLRPLCYAEELDDVPLQDIRIVRDDTVERNESLKNLLTENPFLGRNDEDDFSWLDDTVKDLAYYLRSHKFNEYDRRYETNTETARKEFYAAFPRPPLRALHWEVQQFCEPSFLSCVRYAKRKMKDIALKRVDDTTIAMMEQNWTQFENYEQIQEVEGECVKLREKADRLADPFEGPIERFQWRTTASYYLCWYTMNEVPDLERIKENCDNYAYCLDDTFGVNNLDYRAKDDEPFACATYSFCPDPCCPTVRHSIEAAVCDNNVGNPCYDTNSSGKRRCAFVRSENRNFHDIILNRWNVSCNCPENGYRWSSRYGLCIDVDECSGGNAHGCDNNTEICVNLPGSYQCACRWGYAWNYDENKCTENNALAIIKKERKEDEKNRTVAKSLVKMIFSKLFALKSSSRRISYSWILHVVIYLNFISNKRSGFLV